MLSTGYLLTIFREYPGAPDRGGKEEDTKNYVELVKTLRSTFDNSGQELGITFTAPSSFWYLHWFDLPGMLEYADWVNLVSPSSWDCNERTQGH
jgi:chitinase